MHRLTLAAVAAAVLCAADPAAAAIDRTAAERALSEAAVLCKGGKAVWGVDLCGPMLIADPQTREVVANRPGAGLTPAGGAYVGVLPPGQPVYNGAIDWNGRRWTMVMSTALSDDPHERATLLMHEAWHRIQRDLGFPMNSPTIDYLATPMGRAMVRLEWRALAAALTAEDEPARRRAVADALAFREFRRWTETGPEFERQLEMNEGLAAYTGHRLSGRPDVEAHVARMLARMEKGESFSRSFAYGSGPAYGLLLDRYAPKWRRKLKARDDLGKLLERAVGSKRLGGHVDITAAQARYGGDAVFAEETTRHQARVKAQAAWTARLVDGPVLRIALEGAQFSFDPTNVTPLAPHGSVYPTAEFSGPWGVLTVTDGALIDSSFANVAVQAAPDGGLTGPGWALKLNAGWRVAPGTRAGDFTLARAN